MRPKPRRGCSSSPPSSRSDLDLLTDLTATEIAALLQGRKASCREVAQEFIDRINRENANYNAYLTLDAEGAMAAADSAQAMIDSGHAAPLCGVPVALKDNLSTIGLKTTCASRILENYVPPFDATVVSQLKSQGLVPLGKTNLDEFAMGTTNENSAFGPVCNPWDTERAAGGSSGGSAAAVSAELAPISLGSDTGGSIRFPAALCGLVGFKPTYGRVSRYGLVAFASSLDQIGPFGKCVEDVALLSQAISGHDPLDSTSLPDSKIDISALKSGSVKGLKLGLPDELFGTEIDPEVKDVFELALDNLVRQGAELKRISLPSIGFGVTTYYIIAPAEASSNLARFDGVRFGPRIVGEGHIGNFSKTRGELFGPEVKLRIMVGTYALSSGYYDAYYHRAQQVRGLMAAEFERAYQDVDYVVSPTSPIVAPKLGGIKDQMALKALDMCTIPANMGGFPSISIPCGLAHDLPVGFLLTGPVMGDEVMLRDAYAIEQAFGRDYRRPPIL
ncbi:MAG: Asp-tRNA(Asn)/Glu-tRNA(Gln) amidotransferase subunit GatA [Armatimonadetes bacterium]|nr:Asp-tRNA(Asn)/Glu-tRNA(Gln) amidotransferase subunit GatA [Armatimonadota bacterium]